MNVDEKRICNELWNTYESAVRQLCIYKLRSCPDEADDVISEVFLALCKKVSKSGAPDKPREWLLGTAKNLINKSYHAVYSVREKETSLSELEYVLPYEYDGIERKTDEISDKELIKMFENVLDEEENILMNNIYYGQKKLKDIAVMMNKTESAIKQKHYRTVNKLRKVLKNLENKE